MHFTREPLLDLFSQEWEDTPLRCPVPGSVCISLAGSWPGSWRRAVGGYCHVGPTRSHLSVGSEKDTGTKAAKHSPGRAGRQEPARERKGNEWDGIKSNKEIMKERQHKTERITNRERNRRMRIKRLGGKEKENRNWKICCIYCLKCQENV